MLSEMEPPAWAELKAEMDKEGECRQQVRLDMRYVGQSFELQIPTDLVSQEATVQAFHNQHRARYGHADLSEPVEATALRLTVTGVKPAARLRFPRPRGPLRLSEKPASTVVRAGLRPRSFGARNWQKGKQSLARRFLCSRTRRPFFPKGGRVRPMPMAICGFSLG